MTYKKSLGMGLDLLLTAADHTREQETTGLKQARDLFARAIEEDARENFLEAYYWYRRVIDCGEHCLKNLNTSHFGHLVSQSFNNAAVIACEYNDVEQARSYLNRALEVKPDNVTAQENLRLIIGL